MAKTIKANGLDAILASLADDSLRPGEYTARHVYEQHRQQGGKRSLAAIRFALDSASDRGEMAKRRVVFEGRVTNAYRPE